MSELVIDDAMRYAVYTADCARHGHILLLANVMYSASNGGQADTVGSQNPDELAHITCRRCGSVWLVIEHPAPSYSAAVDALREALVDNTYVTPRPRQAVPSISIDTSSPPGPS